MRTASEEADGEAAHIDPLADLLFTLITAVLPAILLLGPLLDRSTRTVAAKAEARAAMPAPQVTVDGTRASPIIAGADGLRLTGDGGRHIGLDRIGEDEGLRRMLDALKAAGQPVLLIVEPDGLESAFLVEPVLAAYGPAQIAEVRASESCGTARNAALAAACRDEAGPTVSSP